MIIVVMVYLALNTSVFRRSDLREIVQQQMQVSGLVRVDEVPEYPDDSLVAQVLETRCKQLGLPERIADVEVFERRASGGVVIVTFVNGQEAVDPLLLNLLCSWRRLGVSNFVVVATDSMAVDALRAMPDDLLPNEAVHYDPYVWPGTSSEQLRKSSSATDAYLHFIHLRTHFVNMLMHAKTDVHLVVTDADTVWLHNPLALIPSFGTDGCDAHFVEEYSLVGRDVSAYAGQAQPQGGFLMLANTKQVRSLLRDWVQAAVMLNVKEQPALRAALSMRSYAFSWYPSDWPTAAKEGKKLYLCALDPSFVLHTHYFASAEEVEPTFSSGTGTLHAAVMLHPNIAKKARKGQALRHHGGWLLNENDECPATNDLLPPVLPTRALTPPWTPRAGGMLDFGAWLQRPAAATSASRRDGVDCAATLRLSAWTDEPFMLPLELVHPSVRSEVTALLDARNAGTVQVRPADVRQELVLLLHKDGVQVDEQVGRSADGACADGTRWEAALNVLCVGMQGACAFQPPLRIAVPCNESADGAVLVSTPADGAVPVLRASRVPGSGGVLVPPLASWDPEAPQPTKEAKLALKVRKARPRAALEGPFVCAVTEGSFAAFVSGGEDGEDNKVGEGGVSLIPVPSTRYDDGKLDLLLAQVDCVIVGQAEAATSATAWLGAARGAHIVRLANDAKDDLTKRESVLTLDYGVIDAKTAGSSVAVLQQVHSALDEFARRHGMRSRYLDVAQALAGATQMRLRLLQTLWALSQWTTDAGIASGKS